jgi:hypothetical protein
MFVGDKATAPSSVMGSAPVGSYYLTLGLLKKSFREIMGDASHDAFPTRV